MRKQVRRSQFARFLEAAARLEKYLESDFEMLFMKLGVNAPSAAEISQASRSSENALEAGTLEKAPPKRGKDGSR